MYDSSKPFVAFAGRLLLSQIFLLSGVTKLTNWSKTIEMMEQHGMSAVPFMLGAAIAVEIVAGLMLLTGYKTGYAALALALYLVPVTLIFHDFWRYQGGAEQNQLQHFAKNLTIIGGLLTLAAAGAEEISVDYCRLRKPQRSGKLTFGGDSKRLTGGTAG